jgi:hypothetical protein
VVFEPDPGNVRTLLEAGPTDLGGVPITCELFELKAVWHELALGRALATLVVTPGYERRFPAELKELSEAIRMLVEKTQLNENTHRLRSDTWLQDMFGNLELLVGTLPILALAGRFQGVPAFVVGAGPSLDVSGPALREAARKGIVAVVDVAAGACARHEVEPQVLVSIESISLAAQMRNVPWIDRVARSFSLFASPASLRTGAGPLMPFHEDMKEFRPLADLLGVPGVAVGGSVSTAAFTIAERLGCSPIVLVGQDLAYPAGQAYAAGSPFERSRIKVSKSTGRLEYDWCDEVVAAHGNHQGPLPRATPLYEVEAFGGDGVVATTSSFNTFRIWFEVKAESFGRGEGAVRCINTSERGARIRGFEERRLADVVAELPDRPISAADLFAEAKRARPVIGWDDVRRWTERQARSVRVVGKAARSAERAAEQALGALRKDDPRSVGDSFRRLDRAEARLRKVTSVQPMVESAACAELQVLTAQQQDRGRAPDARADAESALATEMRFSKTIAGAARGLESSLHALAERAGKEARSTDTMEKVRCLY